MESVFYAVLALHIAGKPVNKENIRAVLQAAGSVVNDSELDAMAAFVESLESAPYERARPVDPRIVSFLAAELPRQDARDQQMKNLIEELARSVSSVAERREPVLAASRIPVEGKEQSETATLDAAVSTLVTLPGSLLSDHSGSYIYGIAAGGHSIRLGPLGIEGSDVYTIPFRGLCAIVHNCPARPYHSDDTEIVKSWVKTHQSVLDKAKEYFNTVVPLTFDTVLQPRDDSTHPDQAVYDWLEKDHDRLCALLQKVKGKAEYVVQVSYDRELLAEQIASQCQEIRRIRDEMAAKSPGLAYMFRQKLESVLKAEMGKFADERFKAFYSRIVPYCDDVVVERTKKPGENRTILLNLSCLVAHENLNSLGAELEKINNTDGFSVHFSGPWPAYSFVVNPVAPSKEG